MKVIVAGPAPGKAQATLVGRSVHVTEKSARLASPAKVTGTGRTSPATSARLSRTEKSSVEPSGRVAATPSRVTVVTSLSATATVADDGVPTV